jgi:CheY-like chemotaxis protein
MLGLKTPDNAGRPDADESPHLSDPRTADRETILVIDDEAALRDILADVLEENGYNVLTAPDGPAGMEILLSDQSIELLITDVRLPKGMNGREVATAARIRRPGLKILFITGFAGDILMGASRLEKGMELVTKPFDLVRLPGKVRRLIDGE